MGEDDYLESLKYWTERLCARLAELEAGDRQVLFRGADVTTQEAEELRHRIIENLTIMNRLRARRPEKPSDSAA